MKDPERWAERDAELAHDAKVAIKTLLGAAVIAGFYWLIFCAPH